MSANPKLEVTLAGTLDEIGPLAEDIETFLEQHGQDFLIANQVNLILEELYTNAVIHGIPNDRQARVEIMLELTAGQLQITYRDNGVPFNPLEMPEPDLTADIEHRKVGGLGVYFVRQMTQLAEYQRVGDLNELRLTKQLGNEEL